MSASQPAYFNLQEFADLGVPLAGGRLYTYTQGTTAMKTAYTDPDGLVAHTYTADGAGGQYIAMNARGELPAPLYLASGSYDLALKRADGSAVWTRRADPIADAVVALAGPAGAGLVGYSAIAAAVAGTLGAHFKGDVNPADHPWLCKFDGVTDDTAGWNACVSFAKAKGYKISHPGGVLRLTSGFTQNVVRDNIFVIGAGRANEPSATSVASTILLDSNDPAAFFLNLAASCSIRFEGITFKCAQYALDRPFIKYSNGLHGQFFSQCDFENVERPIVWGAGTYFQNAAYRDVQFRNSGTFHSESSALVGTLLVLDNVNHEGSVPINSEKIVCNLQGIRDIWAPNFLLEGTLPAAGWQILNFNLGAVASPNSAVEYAGRFENYHSEWSGANQPAVEFKLNGMLATFSRPVFSVGAIQLNNSALLTLEAWGRVGDSTQLDSSFTFLDSYSRVIVDKSTVRNPALSHARAAQIILRNCNQTYSSAANDAPKAFLFSTHFSEKLWEWAGGLVRSTSRYSAAADGAFAALRTIETDATYGRLIRINRNGQNYPLPAWRVLVTPEMTGKPLTISLLANFPAINGGTYLSMYAGWDGGAFGGSAGVAPIVTGSYVWQQFTVAVPAGATYVEFSVGTNSGVVATDILIAAMRLVCGFDTTPYPLPAYPSQVVSFATAAPTTGTWAAGDRVINSAPAVGAPKAWACTLAGTPGTWVSEGNL